MIGIPVTVQDAGVKLRSGELTSVALGALARTPLSLQIAARPFEEAVALNVGDAYQRLTDWHLKVPPLVRQTVAA